jgi:hypothetical protein
MYIVLVLNILLQINFYFVVNKIHVNMKYLDCKMFADKNKNTELKNINVIKKVYVTGK